MFKPVDNVSIEYSNMVKSHLYLLSIPTSMLLSLYFSNLQTHHESYVCEHWSALKTKRPIVEYGSNISISISVSIFTQWIWILNRY